MLHIALKMLMGDRAKYIGLLLGIAFTAFLISFATSYFCGFMTRGFSLIAENTAVDVWVMDPAVSSVEQTINLPDNALERVHDVEGTGFAAPLVLGAVNARFPDGRFQTFQVIGVDDSGAGRHLCVDRDRYGRRVVRGCRGSRDPDRISIPHDVVHSRGGDHRRADRQSDSGCHQHTACSQTGARRGLRGPLAGFHSPGTRA